MRHFTAMIFLLMAFSCKDNEAGKIAKPIDVEVTECFEYHHSGDTVTMIISRLGDRARGELIYKLFQKDGNVGTFRGDFHGDTLFIDYKFESEGMMSNREEAFLFSGKEMTSLNGEIVMDGLAQRLKDKRNLSVGDVKLQRKTCN